MSRVAVRQVRNPIQAEREGLEGIRLYGSHCRVEAYETAISRMRMLERFAGYSADKTVSLKDVTDVREHLERLRDIWLYQEVLTSGQ